MSNCRSCRFARGGFDCLVISGDNLDEARQVDRWADTVEWIKTADAAYPVDGASLCPGYAPASPVTSVTQGEGMAQEQIDNWFTYHPPTGETAPKYAAIRAAEDACRHGLTMGIGLVDEPAHVRFGHINEACRTFALVIDGQAPDSADKTAAIRCVRLARNAANEAVIDPAGAGRLQAVAFTEIQKARWQANSAIACGGK